MRSNTLYFFLLLSTVMVRSYAGEEATGNGNQSDGEASTYTVQGMLHFLLERVKGGHVHAESQRHPGLKEKLLVVSDTGETTQFRLLTSQEFDTLITDRLGALCVKESIISVGKEVFTDEVMPTEGAGSWQFAAKSFVLWPSSADPKDIHTAVVDVRDFGQKKYEEGRAYERTICGKEALYALGLGAAVGFGVGAIATMCWFFRKPVFNL